jgi:uncharacterized protein (DUF362 family)
MMTHDLESRRRSLLFSKEVAIASSATPIGYPVEPPFRPGDSFPEFHNKVGFSGPPNDVYGLFRDLLHLLGLDREHFSQPGWNPFGSLIRPGDKVVIKPNLVRHIHLGGGDYQAVVTHASIIRCVLDYAALALQGQGELIVGDAPVQSTDFAELVRKNSLQDVCSDVSNVWGIPVRLMDFRLWSVKLDNEHRVVGEGRLAGDLSGYTAVNLGSRSLLNPLNEDATRFRVTNYDCGEMVQHHNERTHEYLIPRTILDADVIINLPKLKTHRKVCLTAGLKNLVGINGHKDWLPHHRTGSLREGGDEYKEPSVLKRLQTSLIEGIDQNPHSLMSHVRRLATRVSIRLNKHFAPDQFLEGSWYGNDTLWRTVLDLNRLLNYADRDGRIAETPQRRCLTIVDGIVAGEGEGPMEPDARRCGILVGGFNPLAVDAVIATMIGFDYSKIPLIANGFRIDQLPLVNYQADEIVVLAGSSDWASLRVGQSCNRLCFVPPSGWQGHVEFPNWERESTEPIPSSSLAGRSS